MAFSEEINGGSEYISSLPLTTNHHSSLTNSKISYCIVYNQDIFIASFDIHFTAKWRYWSGERQEKQWEWR